MRLLSTTLATLLLGALAAAPAEAEEPWWQVLTGSRPTHLQPAPDESEAQEVSTTKADTGFFGEILAARIEVGGELVGCLGAGEYLLLGSADEICEEQTGFPATETPAELAELLEAEALYDGEVQLSGPEGEGEAPASLGTGSFTLTTPKRWVVPLSLTPIVVEDPEGGDLVLGSASAEVTSEGSGILTLVLTNLGDAPLDATSVPLEITDEIPEGLDAYGAQGEAGTNGGAGPVRCALPDTRLVRCTFEDVLPSYEAIEVDVLVALTGKAGKAGAVSVSGGDGPDDGASQPITVSEDPVPFGLESFEMGAEEEGGKETTAASTHPFQLTNTVQFNSGRQTQWGEVRAQSLVEQPALPRNFRFALPAGFAGSAVAVPTCDLATFLTSFELINGCPDKAAVGVASVTVIESNVLGLTRIAVPVFALPPQRGEPARFGFMAAGVPVLIETAVDPEDEYRVIAEVRNAPQTARVLSSTVSIWGVPGDPRHDSSRGWGCAYFSQPGGCPEEFEGLSTEPLLRMPASCAHPFAYEAEVEPWNAAPGAVVDRSSATGGPLGGCNQVPFDPTVTSALTSKAAASPSGLDFGLELKNPWPKNPSLAAEARTEGQFKRTEVILPRGVTLNPSQAEGLATCSEADYARERYDSGPGEGCPEASKVGSVLAHSPLIAEQIEGALYVATPYENPTGAMIAVYLIARIPDRGILVKLAGRVDPDPRSGQLVSVFDDIPQLPVSDFKLHFREGARSPLIAPPGCGEFTTLVRFTPWSAHDPDHPRPDEIVERTEGTTTIERGPEGGPCPTGGAPFHPGFEAGTLNNQAGSYSPFALRLTRRDGEQDMGKFSFTLPPGVIPKLAGIPYCSEEGIARAKSRTGAHGGREEIDDPSCPAASQIGRTVAGAGVGSQLTYVPGSLYLAGPYNGNPISAVAITPAVAGPFDAGTVVVREGLRLNPVTHRGEVDGERSDPIPHILKGIPLNLRDLRVYADRPEFTLNSTSCEPSDASATIWGDGTALEPLPGHPVTLASRYQAAGCASLAFRPRLGLKLRGGTRRGAFPALRATYAPRGGHANLSRLALTFPNSEFIEQGHFRTICTRVQFASGPGFGANCPKGSIYGRVKAWSPLLDEPLQGPVYLRSSNNNLPDAVLALHGLVDIEVAVRIDSVKGRLRAIVQDVPDAPVSRAVVRMRGGQKGLFVNSRNLCRKPGRNRARVNATGQNGRRALLRPLTRAIACAKQRKRARGSHRRAVKRSRSTLRSP